MATVEKTARMDLRLTAAQKTVYERAAHLKGQTLTQWASAHLDQCASRDIEQAEKTFLSPQAFEQFCALLEEPMAAAAQELLAQESIWQ